MASAKVSEVTLAMVSVMASATVSATASATATGAKLAMAMLSEVMLATKSAMTSATESAKASVMVSEVMLAMVSTMAPATVSVMASAMVSEVSVRGWMPGLVSDLVSELSSGLEWVPLVSVQMEVALMLMGQEWPPMSMLAWVLLLVLAVHVAVLVSISGTALTRLNIAVANVVVGARSR